MKKKNGSSYVTKFAALILSFFILFCGVALLGCTRRDYELHVVIVYEPQKKKEWLEDMIEGVGYFIDEVVLFGTVAYSVLVSTDWTRANYIKNSLKECGMYAVVKNYEVSKSLYDLIEEVEDSNASGTLQKALKKFILNYEKHGENMGEVSGVKSVYDEKLIDYGRDSFISLKREILASFGAIVCEIYA